MRFWMSRKPASSGGGRAQPKKARPTAPTPCCTVVRPVSLILCRHRNPEMGQNLPGPTAIHHYNRAGPSRGHLIGQRSFP
jgi:hypothetical protein